MLYVIFDVLWNDLPLSLISNVISFLHCTSSYILSQQWTTQQKTVEYTVEKAKGIKQLSAELLCN